RSARSLVNVVEQNAEILVRERLFDFRPDLVVILGCNPLLAQFLAFESEHEAIFASSRGLSADGRIQLEHLQVDIARLALGSGPEDILEVHQHLLLALGIDRQIQMELNWPLSLRS